MLVCLFCFVETYNWIEGEPGWNGNLWLRGTGGKNNFYLRNRQEGEREEVGEGGDGNLCLGKGRGALTGWQPLTDKRGAGKEGGGGEEWDLWIRKKISSTTV